MKSLPYRRLNEYCQLRLEDAIAAAEAQVRHRVGFGGRIWLLPRHYYRARAKNRRNRLALMEFTTRLLDRPRMCEVAHVSGDVKGRSKVRWTVGKGFVGRVCFGTGFDILQHKERWPHNLDSMTEEEWDELDDEMKEGRTLQDARSLKRLYGTALGASLRHPLTGHPIGCMTIHSPAARPLHTDEARACSELLLVQAVLVSERLATRARLE